MKCQMVDGCCGLNIISHFWNHANPTKTLTRAKLAEFETGESSFGYSWGDGQNTAAHLATVARQPAVKKALEAAGYRVLGKFKSGEGNYFVYLMGKGFAK